MNTKLRNAGSWCQKYASIYSKMIRESDLEKKRKKDSRIIKNILDNKISAERIDIRKCTFCVAYLNP